MIQKSGVIYTYTPQKQESKITVPAGNTSRSVPFEPKKQPKPTFKQPSNPFPPLPNKPFKPPTLRPPVSPFPKTGKPFPWGDPFARKPSVPSAVANAKTLRDIVQPAPMTPPETHHGLPVEVIPEIPLPEVKPVDNTYVDKLFGDTPTVQPEPPSIPVQEHVPVPAPIEEPIQTQHAVTTQTVTPEQHTDQQETATQQPAHPEKPKKKNPFDFLKPKFGVKQTIGVLLIAVSLYGMTLPMIPKLELDAIYASIDKGAQEKALKDIERPLPPSIPIGFNPMMAPDGTMVTPVNTDFAVVIPSVGINSTVLANINPLDSKSYRPALEKGVAHAKTSYLPTQNGSMYLFSHSTNYEWYVKDLNAVFYNVKNLKAGDYIIVFYQGTRYVYEYKDRKIVPPNDTTYLLPQTGKKSLILQTCWPPGSTTERLLIFADLVQEETLSHST